MMKHDNEVGFAKCLIQWKELIVILIEFIAINYSKISHLVVIVYFKYKFTL